MNFCKNECEVEQVVFLGATLLVALSPSVVIVSETLMLIILLYDGLLSHILFDGVEMKT